MPGRLVDVEVDGHHRLEPGERVGQPATRRRRRHGVARDGQQCPDPALAGSGDLLGERRHGQLSPEARQAPHAGAPPAEPPGPEEAPADDVDGRRREHRAARAVEVAGEHVDRLDRPLADHPVGLGRHAHPPVHGGGGRLGELRREPPHGIRGHPGDALGELRGERVDRLADGVDAVDVGGRPSRARGQQLAHDGEQHGGVGARPHEVVLVGHPGGLGPAGVEHDEPAAAGRQLATPLGEVGHRPQRAVRRHRVVADEHEQVGAVDVGHRQEELVAVQGPGDDVVGQLVDRGGGEAVPRAEQPHEGGVVGQGAEAVDVRVAEVDREGVVTVLALHRDQARGRELDRLVPGDLAPPPVGGAAHRPPQPVRVVVHVLQGERLGADVSS